MEGLLFCWWVYELHSTALDFSVKYCKSYACIVYTIYVMSNRHNNLNFIFIYVYIHVILSCSYVTHVCSCFILNMFEALMEDWIVYMYYVKWVSSLNKALVIIIIIIMTILVLKSVTNNINVQIDGRNKTLKKM